MLATTNLSMTGISDGRGEDDLASFPLHRVRCLGNEPASPACVEAGSHMTLLQAADNQDEAEQPDWSPLLPSGLETAQQTMRVDSNCSTTFDTWLDENTILYNVCLIATRDTGIQGGLPAGRQCVCLSMGLWLICTMRMHRPTLPTCLGSSPLHLKHVFCRCWACSCGCCRPCSPLVLLQHLVSQSAHVPCRHSRPDQAQGRHGLLSAGSSGDDGSLVQAAAGAAGGTC